MKKFAFIATLIFMAAFMLSACNTETPASKKVSIVATIYPQYDWLQNILGEHADAVNLKLLIKNGTDLHSYKPSAQDIASIASADMVVFVGGESDEWIEKALEATPKAGRVQVNLMKVLGDRVKEEEIVEGMEHHHEHGEEAEDAAQVIWGSATIPNAKNASFFIIFSLVAYYIKKWAGIKVKNKNVLHLDKSVILYYTTDKQTAKGV